MKNITLVDFMRTGTGNGNVLSQIVDVAVIFLLVLILFVALIVTLGIFGLFLFVTISIFVIDGLSFMVSNILRS